MPYAQSLPHAYRLAFSQRAHRRSPPTTTTAFPRDLRSTGRRIARRATAQRSTRPSRNHNPRVVCRAARRRRWCARARCRRASGVSSNAKAALSFSSRSVQYFQCRLRVDSVEKHPERQGPVIYYSNSYRIPSHMCLLSFIATSMQ